MTFCQSKGGIPYFETSAKEAINVEQAFEGMDFHSLYPNSHTDQQQLLRETLWRKRSHKTSTQTTQRRFQSTSTTRNKAVAV